MEIRDSCNDFLTSTLAFKQGIPLAWCPPEAKSKKPEALLCCTPQLPVSAGRPENNTCPSKNPKKTLANILVLNVGLWCVLRFFGLAAESSQALEKAPGFEEDASLPWRQGTSRELRAKRNWLYLPQLCKPGCKGGAVLPGGSSHLLAKSPRQGKEGIPGRRRRPDLLIQLPEPPMAPGPGNRQAWRGEGSREARQRTEPGRAPRPRPRRTGGSRRTESEGPFQPLTYGTDAPQGNEMFGTGFGEGSDLRGWRTASSPPLPSLRVRRTGRCPPAAPRGGAGRGAVPLRLSRHSARRPLGCHSRLGAGTLPRPPPLSGPGVGAPISRKQSRR